MQKERESHSAKMEVHAPPTVTEQKKFPKYKGGNIMKSKNSVTRRLLAFALALALFFTNYAGYAPMMVYANTDYNVVVDANIEHGTVTVDNSTAAEGEEVTINVTPDDGYDIDTVKYYVDETDFTVVDVNSEYSFTMPASDVTVTATFAEIIPVSYRNCFWNNTHNFVEYNNSNASDYTTLTSRTTTWEDGKWYVAKKDLTISDRITVNGTANLIICGGATLTVSKGITVEEDNTLNIFDQEEDDGALIINGFTDTSDSNNAKYGAGIGAYTVVNGNTIVNPSSCGTVNIHGGNITITGTDYASGIGGSNYSTGDDIKENTGNVTIFSGNINITGGQNSAAIGGGDNESGLTTSIYGGNITVVGGSDGAGIGGGSQGNGGTTTIYGGNINISGGFEGSGIGGGSHGNGGTTTIYDGDIISTAGKVASGIGGGFSGNGGTTTIYGGIITATGSKMNATYYGKGIGCGAESNDDGTLTVGPDIAVLGDSKANPTSEIIPNEGEYVRKQYMFVSKKYPITLHTNGGTINEWYDFSYYIYGKGRDLPTYEEDSDASILQRDGYTFLGWYNNSNFEGNPIVTIAQNESGSKEYWAKWKSKDYFTITYDLAGGTNNENNPVSYNGAVSIKVNVPTNADNTKVFSGWLIYNLMGNVTVADAELPDYLIADKVMDYTIKAGTSGNLKLVATWKDLSEVTSTEVESNVNSEIPGVTISNLDTVATNEVGETTEPIYVRTELQIQKAEEDDVNDVSNEIKAEASTIFTGVDASAIEVKYFNIDITKYQTKVDGTSLDPETVSDAKGVIEIAIPVASIGLESVPTNFGIVREHETDTGKETTVFTELTTKPNSQEEMVDGTFFVDNGVIYIYTQFFSTYAIVNTTTDICHVTLDVNGGNELEKSFYNLAKNECLELPVPTKDGGYTFDGWYLEDGTPVTNTTPITTDVTLKAHWSATSYSISYNLAGGTVDPANPTSYTVETETFTLNNPVKDGFTFAGWTGTDLTEATTTVTIVKGSKGDRSYTATWNEDKEEDKNDDDKNDDDKQDDIPVVSENHSNLYLKATVTNTVAKLSWKKVKGANGYEVYGTTAGSTDFTKIATLKKSKTSYKVTDLESSKDYVYFVKAVNKDGTVAEESLKVYFTTGSGDSSNAKSITASNFKVMMGETVKVQATVNPAESGKTVFGEKYVNLLRYFSSNPSIASVDINGNVTGLSNGKVTIFVYAPNGVMKKVTVNVTNPFIFLEAKVKENASAKTSVVTLKWQKESRAVNYNIYRVISENELKKVDTVKKNKTSYKVTDLEWNNKYEFIVKPVNASGTEYMESIKVQFVAGSDTSTNVKSIKASNQTVTVGGTCTITATVTPQNKNLPVLGDLNYFSSNPNIAVVDNNGKVAGISKGKATIYILAPNGVKKAVKVNVK